MSRYLVFTLAAICLFTADAQSKNIYVKSGENGDGTSWMSPYGSLQTALNNAAAGDVIFMKEGTYKPSVPVNDPVFSIPQGVTIKGGYFGSGDDRDILNHQTILSGDINGNDTSEIHVNKGDNCSMVIKVGWSSGQVVLDGLFVKGGYNDTGYGGGLYVEANNVTVNDCFFSYNYAAHDGGAIYSYGTLEIYNTLGDTWPANFEANYAGNSGGAVGATNILTMQGTNFWNNHAAGSGGGLLVSCGSGSQITNCKIEACSAGYNGGAVFTDCTAAEFTNCLFGNCQAGMFGGGVYNGLAWSSYDRCRFTLCFADAGGGFCSDYGAPTLTNCDLDYCGALFGGGIYVAYEDCSVVNCNLTDNYTDTTHGAGIYVESEYATTTIVNSIIWENYYDWSNKDYDDQVYGTSDITYSCVQNIPSSISPTNTDDYTAENIIDKGSNAAVTTPLDLAGNVRIRDIVDIGPYEGGGAYNVLYVDPDVADSEYNGQSWATAFRYLQDALQVARVDGAKEIWVADGDCYPTQSHDGSLTTGQREDSFVLVEDTKMYGGFRGKDGTYPGELSVSERQGGATVLTGDIDAGGLEDSYHIITLLNLTDGLLDGFTIAHGHADGGQANLNGAGGVLVNVTSGYMINDCVFQNNTTIENGGALYLTGSNPFIVGCAFNLNSAEYGGAIFNYASSPTLDGCTYTENTATGPGAGAVDNQLYSNPVILSCIFKQNEALGVDSAGGAIANQTGSAPEIINCVFAENAAAKGGAVSGHYRSDMRIVNCTCVKNDADTNGGGLYFDSATSRPSVANSIFWYNGINGDDSTTAAQIEPIAAAEVVYSCIKGIDQMNGNINPPSPAFQNYATTVIKPSHDGDESFYLATDSPCIDHGSNDVRYPSIFKDVAGYTRIQFGGIAGDTIDMGAYEYGNEVPSCAFENNSFDSTYCHLMEPESYGWQNIEFGCYALKTTFLVEDDQQCGGYNNQVQTGKCRFKLFLNAASEVRFLVSGNVETHNADFDYGRIYLNGESEDDRVVQIASDKNWGGCGMEIHQDQASVVLAAGEHDILLDVWTKDAVYHKNCYFDFFITIGNYPLGYGTVVDPQQYDDCPSAAMMMSLGAPSRR